MLKTDVAQLVAKKYGKQNPPQLQAGDTVKVHQKIKEGEKERVQIFQGLVIAVKHGRGLDASFTVRKIAVGGIGVERTYPLHSPNVLKVERLKSAKVRQAKLYYMRERAGKQSRFKTEDANVATWVEPAAEAILEEIPAEEAPQEEVIEAIVETAEAQEEMAVAEEPIVDQEVAEEPATEPAPEPDSDTEEEKEEVKAAPESPVA